MLITCKHMRTIIKSSPIQKPVILYSATTTPSSSHPVSPDSFLCVFRLVVPLLLRHRRSFAVFGCRRSIAVFRGFRSFAVFAVAVPLLPTAILYGNWVYIDKRRSWSFH
jgi:hypothetical protein